MSKSVELLRRLDTCARQMNCDELEVLAVVAERLMGPGREQYGPLDIDSDGRDWDQEGGEEFIDAAVYGAVKCIANQRRKVREGC